MEQKRRQEKRVDGKVDLSKAEKRERRGEERRIEEIRIRKKIYEGGHEEGRAGERREKRREAKKMFANPEKLNTYTHTHLACCSPFHLVGIMYIFCI